MLTRYILPDGSEVTNLPARYHHKQPATLARMGVRNIVRDYGGHNLRYYTPGEYADSDDGATVTRAYVMTPNCTLDEAKEERIERLRLECAARVDSIPLLRAQTQRKAITGQALDQDVLDSRTAMIASYDSAVAEVQHDLGTLDAVAAYEWVM